MCDVIPAFRSLIQLHETLSSQYGVRYIRTITLNQDLVENFFSRLRYLSGSHIHPGPVTAKNRIRLLLLGKESDVIVKNSSVQMEQKTDAQKLAVEETLISTKVQ